MSRLANLFVIWLLALTVWYGRFLLPLLVAEEPAGEETPVDLYGNPAELAKRCQAQAELIQWISQDESRVNDRVLSHRRRQRFYLISGSRADDPEAETQMPKGTVAAAFVESPFVMLDIGSISGLRVGQSVQVHRHGPVPFRVGTLEIQQVWPHRAVARIYGPGATVRPGDEVRANLEEFRVYPVYAK
jgi:hypothetical protein